MPHPYFDVAFTPQVQSMQARMGSRASYARSAERHTSEGALGEDELSFIAARDGFYQATVSETGWPYLQFRGGPPGFLVALDSQTLAYADFSGNKQYISVGNLLGNDRLSLFLMDYVHQRRLKLFGHARLVGIDDDPALMQRLTRRDYKAPVERAVVIHVVAFNWNCPQHITPRYSAAEWTD